MLNKALIIEYDTKNIYKTNDTNKGTDLCQLPQCGVDLYFFFDYTIKMEGQGVRLERARARALGYARS